MRHRAVRRQPSTMGAEVRLRRRRVWRSLLRGNPIDPEDRELAIQLSEESGHRLWHGLVRGSGFLVIVATSLWQFFPWTGYDVWMPVTAVIAVGVYLVGIGYALRMRRWLRQNT